MKRSGRTQTSRDIMRGLERQVETTRAALLPTLRLEETVRAALGPAMAQAQIEAAQAVAQFKARQTAALLPPIRQAASLNAEFARAVKPWRAAFASISDWAANLTARMTALQTPWALQYHLEQSALRFAPLSRLRNAVRSEEPYSEPVRELLGAGVEAEREASPTASDTAAREAGVNPVSSPFLPPPCSIRPTGWC